MNDFRHLRQDQLFGWPLSDGPAILALWRLIAWDPRGGMRPNFELKLDDFRAAEGQLLDAMQRLVFDSNR
jgi:hypothetical protein